MALKLSLLAEVNVENILGESVIWDARDQSVWWTDIMGHKIYQLKWPEIELQTFKVPERVCALALTEVVGTLLVAFETGISRYTPADDIPSLQWIFRPFQLGSGIRFNDGRMDRQGRFWVSTMIESSNIALDKSGLFCIEDNGKVTKVLSQFSIGNSLAWLPDSSRMFFSDSSEQTIWSFNFDKKNLITSKRQVYVKQVGHSFPDGADVDHLGNLWCANWGDYSISVYDSQGATIDKHELRISQPTCLAFGGHDMDILFVTSARFELSNKQLKKEPSAGNLFIYKSNTNGMKATIFGRFYDK